MTLKFTAEVVNNYLKYITKVIIYELTTYNDKSFLESLQLPASPGTNPSSESLD